MFVGMGGFCGYGGPVWVRGEWAVGYWIVSVTSFQKIYGLLGLKHHMTQSQMFQKVESDGGPFLKVGFKS